MKNPCRLADPSVAYQLKKLEQGSVCGGQKGAYYKERILVNNTKKEPSWRSAACGTRWKKQDHFTTERRKREL